MNGTADREARKLGTFGGVFVPNVLTILGVILFLRTGWVVGNAGLWGALGILLISNSITLLTSLSLSAIATNTRVGAGGAYFLIARSLGLEIGGSVGVPLYFAQAISVAFYLVGFTESLRFLWPHFDPRFVASGALVSFFAVAWIGAGLVARTQTVILLCLAASLVAFFCGYSPVAASGRAFGPAYAESQNFWSVLAIFFPAVTGIMSGVSLSGDLRDPSRSIPRGTIAAVVITFAIYAWQMTWLALNAERGELLENNMVMHRIARSGHLIFAGLWAATLSSALASLAAAPRTLQALGADGVAPRLLARGFGPSREPRIALVATFLIAEICILVGDLDAIAPVITMFFLATYGTVNLVAGLERLVSNPSYRPSFNVHWAASLLGCGGCVAVMLLINAWATLAAGVVIAGIYVVLTRSRLQVTWGDMRSGMWFALTRFGLLRFETSRQHHRNWRPVILVLCGNPKSRMNLIELAQLLEARRGLLFLAQIVTGDWDKLLPRQAGLQNSLDLFIRENRLSAVGKTVVADDFEHGVLTLLQVGGLGQFEPNTVLMGWSEDVFKHDTFVRAVRRILQLRRNLLILMEAEAGATLEPCIDVWWYARDNGSLMVTLAHLIKAGSVRYRNHRIRVRRIIQNESGVEAARAGTREMLAEYRVSVDVDIIVSPRPPMEVIADRSRSSDTVFVGVSVPQDGSEHNPLARCSVLANNVKGNLLLTKSWQDLGL